MEKALVCGELSEEEGMLQLERAQLSDISDMTRNRDEDLIHELQKTIQERSLRIDSLKVRSKMGQSRVKTRFFQCKNRSFQGISWVLLKGKNSGSFKSQNWAISWSYFNLVFCWLQVNWFLVSESAGWFGCRNTRRDFEIKCRARWANFSIAAGRKNVATTEISTKSTFLLYWTKVSSHYQFFLLSTSGAFDHNW